MTAIDHALQIKPDYVEAIVYKGLLLRLQANLEKDPAKQQQLLKDATSSAKRRTRCARQGCRRGALNARNVGSSPLQAVGSEGRQGDLTAFFCLTAVTAAAVKYWLFATIHFSTNGGRA